MFQHEQSQSQCDVQVGSLFLSANQYILPSHISANKYILPSYFSASFLTYLEAARDKIVPISTRTDRPKRAIAQVDYYMTDFKEVHQDPQEKTN